MTEIMTLEEKIEKEKMLAEIHRKQAREADELFYFKDMQKTYREGNIKEAEGHDQYAAWLEELKEYREIGTLEECRAAVEKQRAKKVTDIHVDEYRCPACGSENTTSDTLTAGDHYCLNCGQRLER